MLTARTAGLTGVAMLAFAANSLLCRAALERGLIDPASFATIRLVSGAVILMALARRHHPTGKVQTPTDWLAASMLFAYVALFSFAYVSLSAGTGALILFGAVQLAMFASGLHAGERFSAIEWVGLAVAFAGLVYLVSPGVTAPSPLGAAAMAAAGVAWGVYSLRGRRAGNPLMLSAAHFARAAPMAIALNLILWPQAHAQASGVWLAVASGAVTSGLGYVVWYAALKGLGAMRAATVQLSVPPIAALGGVWLLSEALDFRLVVASAAILGGIALALMSRR